VTRDALIEKSKKEKQYIARDSVDVHAFYDRKTDLTYFFVLPSMKLLEEKGVKFDK
jgi:hypothetical protein